MKPRILITGAGGLIGGALVRDPRLAERYSVRTVSRVALLPVAPDHEQRLGDLALLAEDPDLLDGITQVVHCAGTVRNWAGRAGLFKDDVVMLRALAAGSRRKGLARLLYLSSASVYARASHLRAVRETDIPARPMTDYARTKLACEAALADAGVPYLVLRPRMVIGPGDRHVLPAMIATRRRRRYFPRLGDGSARIAVTSIGNMVDALLLALDAPAHIRSEAINIANAAPVNAWALADAVFDRLALPPATGRFPYGAAIAIARGFEAAARFMGTASAPPMTVSGVTSMARDFTLDLGKARALLGYDPRDDLDATLDAFASWYRAARGGTPI